MTFFESTDNHLPDARKIISNANKLIIKITSPVKFGCITTVTLYILKPLVTDLIFYVFYDIEPSRDLILKAKFLYDAKESPAYELTYLYQAYATILVGTIVVRKKLLLIKSLRLIFFFYSM